MVTSRNTAILLFPFAVFTGILLQDYYGSGSTVQGIVHVFKRENVHPCMHFQVSTRSLHQHGVPHHLSTLSDMLSLSLKAFLTLVPFLTLSSGAVLEYRKQYHHHGGGGGGGSGGGGHFANDTCSAEPPVLSCQDTVRQAPSICAILGTDNCPKSPIRRTLVAHLSQVA